MAIGSDLKHGGSGINADRAMQKLAANCHRDMPDRRRTAEGFFTISHFSSQGNWQPPNRSSLPYVSLKFVARQ
ncbi:hypothetical protein [Rhizobium herbae]|uniref:Uncharacterized protein n=1 Tax=Rhizobium herbae TaxID=508661 RepID=A0ABS4EPZ6_9HYPH|nr:hypothetical protein [Rhizobium herbae]MBP1860018.1 hypothetical protein [Rhizobium herbae]